MLKKAIAVIIACCLLLCLAGCSKTSTSSEQTNSENSKPQNSGESAETAGSGSLKLLYCTKDSLNPYAAETKVNQELCFLMFDPLVTLDNAFNPVYVLAQNVTVNKDKTVAVTLKNNVRFSDNTPVSADDIVFSFNLAKKSTTSAYAAHLSIVTSCVKISESTVQFKLLKNDPYAANLLDFPILKNGSTERKNEDNVSLPPIGCGKYVFDDKSDILVANANYHGGSLLIKTINLTNTPDNESANHHIEVGNSDIYYNSTAEANTLRMSNSKRKQINTTNLIFLGANMNSGVASNIYVRYAVSAAIDRKAITKTAYYSSATPANGIFHPIWKESKSFQTIQTSPVREITVVNLKQIGYNSFDKDGFAVNSKGSRLSIKILVNKDNASKKSAADLIASQLCSAGIYATVDAVPHSTYLNRIAAKQFDFYLAETRLAHNMDITPLVYPGGSVAYGIAPKQSSTPVVNTSSSTPAQPNSPQETDINLTTWQILDRFYSGSATIADVVSIFESELPVIPICYLNANLFYTKELSDEPAGSVANPFLGIELFKLNRK